MNKIALLSDEELKKIKKDDVIERMLAFTIPTYLIVTKVTDDRIITGWWEFDRDTGIEIDEDIPASVSYIRRVMTEEQKVLIKEGKTI